MRTRKDSPDATPVGDTSLLFVPSSSEDPSGSGVAALMGMLDAEEAPSAPSPAPPQSS